MILVSEKCRRATDQLQYWSVLSAKYWPFIIVLKRHRLNMSVLCTVASSMPVGLGCLPGRHIRRMTVRATQDDGVIYYGGSLYTEAEVWLCCCLSQESNSACFSTGPTGPLCCESRRLRCTVAVTFTLLCNGRVHWQYYTFQSLI